MAEEVRIGVYICHCGFNIAGTVDVKAVAEYAKTLPNVVVSRDYLFMCSEPGQDLIREDIKKYKLNRIVVAACSPSMHEPTFRSVLESAGLNKYLFEMANIREHCSWVHSDKELATEKAKDLVRMAVAKARLLEPLEEKEIETSRNILVVGGGVAGMRAALELAHYGFEVYLIEKSPTLGGKAALVGYVEDDVKGSEIVGKMIKLISKNPRIHVFTNSELVEFKGFPGNFIAKIRVNPRYVNEKCTLCGDCIPACPVEVSNEYEFGLDKRKAIFYPYKGAYPPYYVIDSKVCTFCGECVKTCKHNAIDLEMKPQYLDLRIGALIIAAGYDPYEPPKGEYNYGIHNNVITLFQLERLLDPNGPTKGNLIIGGKVPRRIVFIQCVGSRNTTPNSKPYCSRMCCLTAIRNAIRIKEMYPDTDVIILYKDIMTYASDERLYEEAGKRLVKFLKFEEPPKVTITEEGLYIDVYEYTIQDEVRIPTDLVVLSTGMVPRHDLNELIAVTRISCGGDGFLRELHLKLAPVESPTKGVYLAGAVTGPKNIMESIRMGSAAAVKAMTLLSAGKVSIEPLTAVVNEEICSGCGVCVSVCPYEAISIKEMDGDRLAHVEEALCMGCGTCTAACPSGAMQQRGFKDTQIKAQVLAVFGGG
ncbi:disulfide reductase [Candidatus Geothermarchaeota archaeon]|nr:MAG: disulfide reductase [Candidatus Geothermarchaeota archaeon]